MRRINLILICLAVIFVSLLGFVFWDVYANRVSGYNSGADSAALPNGNVSNIGNNVSGSQNNSAVKPNNSSSATNSSIKPPAAGNVSNKPKNNSSPNNSSASKPSKKPQTNIDLNSTPKQKTEYPSVEQFTIENAGSVILGRPTDKSIAASVIATKGMEAFIEYGIISGPYSQKSATFASEIGNPIVIEIDSLEAGKEYYYRVNYRASEQTSFVSGNEYTFSTAKPSGSSFTFAVQGDSHPERLGTMFSPELYKLTMNNVLLDKPDLYFTAGDDFSIENLIEKNTVSEETVDRAYLDQRNYLGIIGSSVPLFLVNGNHEQAAKYLLDGTSNNPAVIAANSRIKNYPLPAPNSFYSGDLEEVEFVGQLRDYYAFKWGDALFITIDPYWHSDIPVDNVAGSDGEKRSDLWDITLGDEQYQWFKKTLAESDAKYKFVFTHHVLGTGRGGIENVKLYEWGGYGSNGLWEFEQKRPGWELPIHQLMAKNNVTIFFQGHDHLFAKQELDGVIYQSIPNPADDTYTAFNRDAYTVGDTLPNSGHLSINVSSDKVTVQYIGSFLPGDGANGQVAYSYEVTQ